MAMTIRFTRGKGKPDTISCFRDDGTSTYSRGLVVHDIVHYAVETGLSSDPPMNWRLSALRAVAPEKKKPW